MFENLFGIPEIKEKKAPSEGGVFEGLFEKPEKKPTDWTLEYPEWQPTTPGLKALKEAGSAPPIEKEPSVWEEKELPLPTWKETPVEEFKLEVGEMPPKPKEEIKESKIKDIWDQFYLTGKRMWERTKTYFVDTLPNTVFRDIEPGFHPMRIAFPLGTSPFESMYVTEKQAKTVNKVNKKLRPVFKKSYDKSQLRYREWLSSHPELYPRKEWEKGVIETVKEDPSVLLDPAYWGYVAATPIAFSGAVMGTTAATFALTKNPWLSLMSAMAVMTPMESQDITEDLKREGVDDEQAAILGAIIGPVIAGVEVAGDLPILSALSPTFKKALFGQIKKQVVKKVVKDFTVKGILKKGIKTFTTVEIVETLEELIQGVIQRVTVKTVAENKGILESIVEYFKEEAPETIAQTLMGTAPLALLGAGGEIRAGVIEEKKKAPPAKPIFDGLFVKPEVKPEVKAKPKLPEIKKPPKEEGKLYAVAIMPDPGLDKFLSEEVRPVLNKAMEAGKFLGKTGRHIPEFMMRIIEPAKLVAGEPYATVIRGIHKPEARLVEFDQKRLETMDTNISELEKWFDKFSDKDLGNLMLTRGKTSSLEARRIQIKAFAEISKELKVPAIKKAIQEIADFNYKFLQEVAGKDIHKVEDYFYGMYKNPKKVSKFLDYWRSTEKFTKQKIFPTVADAKAYGLELKYKNPVANLRSEFRAIANLEGMNWMKEELLRTGKGIYIEETSKAPLEWDKVNDPVFRDLRVEPNLARLINNLISTNKITRIPVLNALRKINNTLRTYKFIGSAFHAVSIAKQSAVDSGYFGFAYKKTAVRGATFGFRENDPIFRSPEYLEYIELGGGHKYSAEFQSKKIVTDFVDKVNRGNFLGAFTKIGIFPAKIPKGFVNWMFNRFIPKVKYAKYLDFVAKREKDLGRMTTDKEKIEIIKEGQNFYGMMNERLFGRSGTVTTALRFVFLAPGYAEGNYRTIIKSFSQWGVKGTYGAGRSRFNIVNSLLLTGILATVGTLIFTKKLPEKPKKIEDIRDLFKVDTGYVDDKGRRVMIDLMTYDKDYWNVTFNILRGRPDVAITQSVTRLGGMKAPTAEMLWDFSGMLM
ncbi:MAG TPA: hypothetical protein VMW39_07700, partial [bacterium]|nr:hypothetical protein [bacterium]